MRDHGSNGSVPLLLFVSPERMRCRLYSIPKLCFEIEILALIALGLRYNRKSLFAIVEGERKERNEVFKAFKHVLETK